MIVPALAAEKLTETRVDVNAWVHLGNFTVFDAKSLAPLLTHAERADKEVGRLESPYSTAGLLARVSTRSSASLLKKKSEQSARRLARTEGGLSCGTGCSTSRTSKSDSVRTRQRRCCWRYWKLLAAQQGSDWQRAPPTAAGVATTAEVQRWRGTPPR